MIRLYQYAPALGLPNASPFCMKLETYLRMAQLPFVAPQISLREMGRAPKGKLPYVRDGATVLADSTLIIEHFKTTYGDPLDAWLSAEQRAVALSFQRLLEENLYWAVLHSRWMEPQGWAMTKQAFFGTLPVPLRWIVPTLARRGLRQQLRGHGMGRHSAQEIHAIGQRDITALADFLGHKPYFMGDEPCSLDASAYAFLANLVWVPLESPLKQHAARYPQLEVYCRRMRSHYYTDGWVG